MLLKLADAIEAQAETFARLESLNCGKPYARALGDEIPAVADCFRFFAGACRTLTGPLAGEYLAGHTSIIRRDPVGVVGSIAPWNYPLMMAAWKTAPALAAGNTVVIKPSEQTPLSTLWLAKVAAEIFPKGVFNVIAGRGASVGPAAGRAPQGGDGQPDRRRLHRPQDPAGRQQHAQAHAPRARRQGAGDRVRRRRPRGRGRGPAHLRLLQRRPGLHRRLPHLRRRQDLRQAGGRPVERGEEHQDRHAGRARCRDRPADQRPPAQPRGQLRRARADDRPHGDHRRRQGARRAAASSTSPR